MYDTTIIGAHGLPLTAIAQFDSGVSIKIESLNLSNWHSKFSEQSYKVHLGNEHSSESYVVDGSFSNNGVTVQIPDVLASEPFPIIGFVQSVGDKGNVTLCRFQLNVHKRPM